MAIEDPVNFMKSRGYGLAEKVKIEEKVYTSGGSMGHGENITQTHGDLIQIGKAKITYAKPQEMNKKSNLEPGGNKGKYSSIETAKYNLTKPKGQDNRKTAHFHENKKTVYHNRMRD